MFTNYPRLECPRGPTLLGGLVSGITLQNNQDKHQKLVVNKNYDYFQIKLKDFLYFPY